MKLVFFFVACLPFCYCERPPCEGDALGMGNEAIHDQRITSSSVLSNSTLAKYGRLNFSGGSWCASESDGVTHYLEVDLTSLHAICAVATQGNSKAGQWVEKYQLQTSTNRKNWSSYKEGGQIRDFQGNTDRKTTVKHVLFEGVVARYIRVMPKTWHGLCCLRIELYGARDHFCQTTPVGIAHRSKIPNHRMNATTSYLDYNNTYGPEKGRFGKTNCAWKAKEAFTGADYLQVDLGGSYFICALATKGNLCDLQEWTKKYKTYLSQDNIYWSQYRENATFKIFAGNVDSNTTQKNIVNTLPRAKFIRFWPTEIHTWTALRVEVYGVAQGCRASLGMEDNLISDVHVTASSNPITAHNGRLYKTSAWCSSDANAGYLQVDFSQVKTVTGVATQGNYSNRSWVKTYHISYKYESSPWIDYKLKQDKGSWKTFNGNVINNEVRVNWLPVPVAARYIRVVADSWTPSRSGPCLRIDLYGCNHILRPRMTLKNPTIPSSGPTIGPTSLTLTCTVSSQPHTAIEWWNKDKNLTSLSTVEYLSANGSVDGSVSVSRLQINFQREEFNYDCKTSTANCNVQFSCIAYLPGSRTETHFTRSIVVPVTLVKPRFETFQQNKISVQGDNVILACNATGVPPPNITWTFNNGALPSSSKRFLNAVLLNNVQNNEEYEGLYTCHAENRVRKINTTMFLTVDEKPTATSSPKSTTTQIGKKLELNCDVGGDPRPQVRWTKDGSSNISRANITTPLNTTLVIESVRLEDQGTYKCKVENRAGKDYSSSTVIIRHLATEIKAGALVPTPKTLQTFAKSRLSSENRAGKGYSSSTVIIRHLVTEIKGSDSNAKVTGLTIEMVWAPLVAVILFSVLLFTGWRVKRRCSQDNSHAHSSPEVPPAYPALSLVKRRRPSDPWEVFEEDVVIQGFLGVGAFGEVWRAVVQHVGRIKGNRECAVKKLRVSVSREARKKFMKEIELGKMLGSEGHPNIVNFLGCVTRTENPMMIMEYTPHGDLLGFMRKSRGVEDKHHVGKDEPVKKLTNYDLVNFAQQIACGMKFLKSKGIMHRDLAARNVLVGNDFVCKVTDFGLACQTEKYGYGSAKMGRLPTKWTAPEVLFDTSSFQISSKSDVWSYGIVLYEIFTLGGTPYADFGHNDLIVQLSTKHYRMPKPDHISDNIYELMMLCWSEDPAGRPSFEELHETFLSMIAENHYMEVFDEVRYENHLYQPEKFAGEVSNSDDAPEEQQRGATGAAEDKKAETGAAEVDTKMVTMKIKAETDIDLSV